MTRMLLPLFLFFVCGCSVVPTFTVNVEEKQPSHFVYSASMKLDIRRAHEYR